MGRDVPFKRNAVCDICGKPGAYDFMGDYMCQECSDKVIERDGPNEKEFENGEGLVEWPGDED